MQKRLSFIISVFCSLACVATAQEATQVSSLEKLPFGDFDSWTIRKIKESSIIGGHYKTLYVVGPQDTLYGNRPYDYSTHTPWNSSNAYAKVAGIHKGSNTVYPEKRGQGYCARLETKVEEIKVMGFINISVLVSGSLTLGETVEPITSANDPYENINFGIPFTRKPKALVLDYKCIISPNDFVILNSTTVNKRIKGIQDKAEVFVYLQKRWEDKNGKLHALRVGTAREQFDQTQSEWVNGHRVTIHYGDISQTDYYQDFMHLNGPYRAKNSRGEIVKIEEEGWADANDSPTHAIVMITSGNQGAFIGTEGNTLWVDNVYLEF